MSEVQETELGMTSGRCWSAAILGYLAHPRRRIE
jgi:hypothetical protein